MNLTTRRFFARRGLGRSISAYLAESKQEWAVLLNKMKLFKHLLSLDQAFCKYIARSEKFSNIQFRASFQDISSFGSRRAPTSACFFRLKSSTTTLCEIKHVLLRDLLSGQFQWPKYRSAHINHGTGQHLRQNQSDFFRIPPPQSGLKPDCLETAKACFTRTCPTASDLQYAGMDGRTVILNLYRYIDSKFNDI